MAESSRPGAAHQTDADMNADEQSPDRSGKELAAAEPGRAHKLRQLRASYYAQLPERLDELRAAWSAALAGEERRASLRTFQRLAHNLAGSAGTFGCPELGATARAIEELIVDLDENWAAMPPRIEAISDRLASLEPPSSEPLAVAGPAAVPVANEGMEPDQAMGLYLIEDDAPLRQEIAALTHAYGWQTHSFGEAGAALEALATHRPEAMIVDLSRPEGKLAGIEVVERARAIAAELPVILLSALWNWESRLAAARVGVNAYLVKPIDLSLLVDQIDRLTKKTSADPYRVLIIDDSAMLAEHYAGVLNAAGMRAEAITEPQRLLESLETLQPELMLTDLYMPGCTGIEVARIIRQDERYASMPIVFLSTEAGRKQQLAAMQAGADDFLTKPVRDAELVLAVKQRITRARALAALINRDSLTGLLNRIAFDLQAEAEIDRAARSAAPLTLAMLDIDHFKRVNDSHGHPVGDRVIKSLAQLLRKRLRKYDVIARYGGEEFSILMPSTPPETAMAVLDTLRQQFAQLSQATAAGMCHCTFSAGLAALNKTMDRGRLVEAADAALYAAKRAGRNRVCRADGKGDAA